MSQNRFLRFSLRVFSVALVLGLAACGSSEYSSKQAKTAPTRSYAQSTSPQNHWRPRRNNTIPMTMNSKVKRMVKIFTGNLRPSFDRWMMRIGMYGPTIEKVLKEEGVPQDLIYLAMIESGFNLSAKSHASAVGPWQFIHSTGKMYGLKNDMFMDDRRDLIVSTRAAARHLKDLYKMYGDWYLAFAAYNAGPGYVNRAIKRTRSKSFWKHTHTRYLPRETKEYVPKILAAMHIVKNYRKYGYTEKSFAPPMEYDVTTVKGAADVAVLANSANTSIGNIQQLNPALVSGITRPNAENYVYVPKGRKSQFDRRLRSVPSSKRVSFLIHVAQKGESVASLAKFYGISQVQIAKANKIRTSSRLKTGREYRIPATKTVLAAMANKPLITRKRSSRYHKVKKGENLSRIARKYRLKTKSLAKMNRISTRSTLRIGQRLKVGSSVKKGSGRTFYAMGLSNKKWRAPKMNTYYASNSKPKRLKRKKLSGVSHIILQDEKAGGSEEYAMNDTPSNNNFNITDLSAETEAPLADQAIETPGKIMTGKEAEEETLVVAAPVKKHRSASTYKVRSGDTLSTIALKHNMSMDQLKAYNGLKSNNIYVNQTLRLKPRYGTHTVKSGENLHLIARKYKMSVASLKKLNGLKSDFLKPKQRLKVAGGSSATTNSRRKVTYKYHVVKPGESLGVIAERHKISVASLKKLNNLSGDFIKVNQRLRLNSSTPIAKAPAKRRSYITHRIESGDTLWGLAKKYRVSVSDIKKWNSLKTDSLRANQKLKIFANNRNS